MSHVLDYRGDVHRCALRRTARGLLLVGGLFLLVGLVACVVLRCLVTYTVKQKTALSER